MEDLRLERARRVKWDLADKTGLRYEDGVKNVEYFRDVKPQLQRSCVACHSKDYKERSPLWSWTRTMRR